MTMRIVDSKILAVVPFWRRPEISYNFWLAMNRLRETVNVEVMAVLSDGDNQNRILSKHADYTMDYRNIPVGAKWNAGVQATKELDYDYLLIIGSDDILTREFLEMYEGEPEYAGVTDAVAINMYNKKYRYFKGYTNNRIGETVGSGRMIRRDTLERLNYTPFPQRSNSLDFDMTRILSEQGIECQTFTTGLKPIRLGLKTHDAITRMRNNFTIKADFKELEQLYGKELVQRIKDY